MPGAPGCPGAALRLPLCYIRLTKHIAHASLPLPLTLAPQVPFSACLERLVAPELLDDYHSAALGRRTKATKQTRVASFPPYLMLALRRYYVGEGWVPKKLDVLVEVRHDQGFINPSSYHYQKHSKVFPLHCDESWGATEAG